MKFQIGDKVIVPHTEEEGEVVEIIDQKMVMVNVRGVKFPAYIDQLDFPYFKRFTEKKLFPSKPARKFVDQIATDNKKDTARIADGVWLNFIPVFENDEFGDDIVASLKIHLINNSVQDYVFKYKLQYGGRTDFELDNQVFHFNNFYLNDIPFENLNDSPSFEFDFSLIKQDNKKAPHFECVLKLKAKQVFTKIEEIKKKGDAGFSYKLFDHYPDKIVEEIDSRPALAAAGYRVYEASRVRQHLQASKHEVDLHIEKLTKDWQSLNNFEMLTLQLQTLEKWIDIAVAHHQSSMVVIHGVGSGKLRDEIHEVLRMRREVKSFVNQYHPRYGYGATEIFFQY